MSSSEAPALTSNKTLVLIFADPRPPPLTLAKRGARRALVFHEAPLPHLFLYKGARPGGGASTLAGTISPAMGHHASAFEENQTIHINRCNKTNINIMKDIHRKTHSFHEMCDASVGPKYLYKTSVKRHLVSLSHTSIFSVSMIAPASASGASV
jgi:hypothetical protein